MNGAPGLHAEGPKGCGSVRLSMKQRKLRRREREATCARLRVWSSNTQGLPQFRALLGLIQQTPALRRSCAAVLQQETQRDAIGTGIYREECARRGV
jgi:hypothetical protein